MGLAPLLLLVLTAASGLWLVWHPVPVNEATLRFWTFARDHFNAYAPVIPPFEEAHPNTVVDMQLVHGEAVTSRLRAAFWSDLDVPDIVEVNIDRTGSFFRGGVEDVGFIDLTPFLRSSGVYDRIPRTRFAPYTNRGHIFGLPHDVHPVMLAYRRDLFEELGIDASRLTTWEAFIEAGRRASIRTGATPRYMIDLNHAGSSSLEVILFQRGGGYFDEDGHLIMGSELTVETIQWYIPLVAGPERIAANAGWGAGFSRAVEDGYVLTFICPDWRTRILEQDVPRVKGKMALMPLPAFADDPRPRRTSTWGGTMVSITKACKDKNLAWALIERLYLNPSELAERFRQTNILPPLKDAWDEPAFGEPRAYWSGQAIGKLYADLAEEVPPQYSSPFVEVAKAKLGQVIAACVTYYNQNGHDEGFDGFVRQRLALACEEVRKQMTRNPFVE